MGFSRLDVAHISFPQSPLLMTGPIRVPLALLPAPFLVNLVSLSWGWAFLDVPLRRELWIRAHSGLGKIPVVLTLLGLSSSLQCTTKSSNSPLWGEKVVVLASWGELLI